MSRLDDLEKLASLRDKGALTDEEFEREKAKVMAGTGAGAAPASQPIAPQALTTCPNCKGQAFPKNSQCPSCGHKPGDPKKSDAGGKLVGLLIAAFVAMFVLSLPISSPSWGWLLPVLLGVVVCGLVIKQVEKTKVRLLAGLALGYLALFGFVAVSSVIAEGAAEEKREKEAAEKAARRTKLGDEFKTALAGGKLREAAKNLSALRSEYSGDPELASMTQQLTSAQEKKSAELTASVREAVGQKSWDAAAASCAEAAGLPSNPERTAFCDAAAAGKAVAASNWADAWAACGRLPDLTVAWANQQCSAAAEGLLDARSEAILGARSEKDWAAGKQPCEELGDLRERRSQLNKACSTIEKEFEKERAAKERAAREKKVQAKVAAALVVANDKEKCDRPMDVEAAWLQIRGVTKEDPGFSKARSAVRKLERCRKTMERELGNGVREVMRAQRERHAAQLDRAFLDEGMDATVRAIGKNQTTLKLTYVLFNRARAHQMTDGGSMRDPSMLLTAQKMGFKKVVFSDGYNESFTYTLEPEDESKAGEMALPAGLKAPLKL